MKTEGESIPRKGEGNLILCWIQEKDMIVIVFFRQRKSQIVLGSGKKKKSRWIWSFLHVRFLTPKWEKDWKSDCITNYIIIRIASAQPIPKDYLDSSNIQEGDLLAIQKIMNKNFQTIWKMLVRKWYREGNWVQCKTSSELRRDCPLENRLVRRRG